MEKAVLMKIKDIKSDLLRSERYQNGFKENRSTGNNLAIVVNKIFRRDKEKRESMMLIDLQKAYDSVDRSLLI
jgi:hypothetical protein